MTAKELRSKIASSRSFKNVFVMYGYNETVNGGWIKTKTTVPGVALTADQVFDAILKEHPEPEPQSNMRVEFTPPAPPKGFNFPHPMKQTGNTDFSILAFGYNEKALVLSVNEDSNYKPGDMISVYIDEFEPIFEKVVITFNDNQ